MSVSTIYHSKT